MYVANSRVKFFPVTICDIVQFFEKHYLLWSSRLNNLLLQL